jgi:hypothetical protein
MGHWPLLKILSALLRTKRRFADYKRMPHYYFVAHYNNASTHPGDGIDSTYPGDGIDLPSAEAAWEEATKTAGEMLKDIDGELRAGAEWSIQILDASCKPIQTLRIVVETPE